MRLYLLSLYLLSVGCDSDKAVKAFNSDPTATITSHSNGDTLASGVLTTFRGSVADSNHQSAELTVTWFAGAREICPSQAPAEDGTTSCEAALDLNENEVSLEVIDPNGAAGAAALTFDMVNPGPDVDITYPSEDTSFSEGNSITLTGVATDENHGSSELVGTWFSETTILCEATPLDSTGQSSCELEVTLADTEIRFEVVDPLGEQGNATLSLQVLPTEAPTASILHPMASGQYYSDQLIVFEGLISDAEDAVDSLDTSWESSMDGLLTDVDTAPDSDGTIMGYGYLSEGQHAIELQVTDSQEKTTTASVIIAVGPPNTAPSCGITSPTTGSVGTAGDAITFTAAVDDVDIDANQLTVEWVSDKDGSLGTSTPSSAGEVVFNFSDLSINSHTITLIVSDEVGASCSDLILYTVDTPPSVNITSPTTGMVYNEGEAISFTAEVSDTQDAPTDISLSWDLNGSVFSNQAATSSGTAQFTDASLSFGSYTLTVTATDTAGLSDSHQQTFTINGIPSQPAVDISPTPATTSDTLLANLSTPSIDPEGSVISYTYEWLRDGVLQSSYGAASLPATATTKGEQWTVRVTPNDGTTNGPAAEASIVVENTAPVLSTPIITPSSGVYTDTILTCSSTVTDPDESPAVSYAWTIAGQTVGSGPSLDLSNVSVTPGDIVVCNASATDSDGASASASTSVSVENRPPSVDAIQLQPTTAYTNDILTAIPTLNDTDSGQTLTASYRWHVIDAATGVDTEVQSGNNSTLDGTVFFHRDDEVYVIVTPNDGLVDGAPLTSSSLTIANSAPAQPTVSISPNPAAAQVDDLICSVDLPSSDDDGDTVLYTYVWTDPAGVVQQTTSAVSATSDSFAGIDTTEGIWTCEVTPADDSDSGPSHSATTSVEDSLMAQYDCSSHQDNGNEYLFCQTQVSWFEAKNVCSQFEAYLVSINDTAENSFLLTQAVSLDNLTGNSENHNWWTGYNDIVSEGSWEWDGYPASFSNWRSGEPNNNFNGLSEDCGVLAWYGNNWNDLPCNETDNYQNFICEISEDVDNDGYFIFEDCDDNNADIHPFGGDTYNDGIDSDCDGTDLCEAAELNGVYFSACYEPMPWQDAHNTCQSRGYDGLATLLDDQENTFVHALFPVHVMSSAGLYWVGYNDISSEGSFTWASGISSSYSNWNTSEPSNGGGNEDCTMLYSNVFTPYLRWNDHPCSNSHSYVCEER